MRTKTSAVMVVALIVMTACGRQPEPPADDNALRADERTAVAPAQQAADTDADPAGTDADPEADLLAGTPYAGTLPEAQPERPPIDAKEAREVRLQVWSETGYLNERKAYTVDLLERDMAYLTLRIETPEGRPVRGAKPHFEVVGTSRLVPMGTSDSTEESGTIDFGVTGGAMGSDRVTVSYGNQTFDVMINVISLKAAGFGPLEEIKGGLRWEALMKARLRFGKDTVSADFPADIAAQNGKTVKLIGFMMPLDPEQDQKHFLLTSNPPSCFFHIPGGPAGAVEIFAEKGIKATWDPIVLEGRFETVQNNEVGVIYRLHKARVVSK